MKTSVLLGVLKIVQEVRLDATASSILSQPAFLSLEVMVNASHERPEARRVVVFQ